MKRFYRDKKLHLIILIAISFLLYANTLQNKFVYDDFTLIVDNYLIRNFANIKNLDIFKQPVRMITFMLDFHLYRLNPTGYHLTNIILHVLTVILVYFVTFKLFSNLFLAFLCALLFASHPIHTEAVACISNRKEMLFSLFFLISFLTFLKSEQNKWFIFISVICFLLALFSKFVAISLPLVILLYSWVFKKKKELLNAIPHFVIMLLIFILFWKYRAKIFVQVKEVPLTLKEYPIVTFTMLKALLIYYYLLIFPYNLCAEHDVALATKFYQPEVLISFILTALAIYYAFKTKRKLMKFGILWFYINFLPVSNILPINYIVAERYMYLPVFAFSLILAYYLLKLFNKNEKAGFSALIVLLLLYSVRVVTRNRDWHDSIALWQKTIKQSPGKAVAYNNLGTAYQRKGDLRKAYEYYKKAIEIDPSYVQAYYNLGNVFIATGQFKDAEKMFRQVVKIDPSAYRGYFGIAIAKMYLGQPDSSLNYLVRTVSIEPSFLPAYLEGVKVALKLNLLWVADTACKLAVKIDPKNPEIYLIWGNVYFFKKDYIKAKEMYEKALELNEKFPEPYYNLGRVYEILGEYEKAINYFKRFLKLVPYGKAAEGARYEIEKLKKFFSKSNKN